MHSASAPSKDHTNVSPAVTPNTHNHNQTDGGRDVAAAVDTLSNYSSTGGGESSSSSSSSDGGGCFSRFSFRQFITTPIVSGLLVFFSIVITATCVAVIMAMFTQNGADEMGTKMAQFMSDRTRESVTGMLSGGNRSAQSMQWAVKAQPSAPIPIEEPRTGDAKWGKWHMPLAFAQNALQGMRMVILGFHDGSSVYWDINTTATTIAFSIADVNTTGCPTKYCDGVSNPSWNNGTLYNQSSADVISLYSYPISFDPRNEAWYMRGGIGEMDFKWSRLRISTLGGASIYNHRDEYVNVLTILYSLYNRSHDEVGVGAVEMEISQLETIVESERPTENSQVLIIDSDNRVVATSTSRIDYFPAGCSATNPELNDYDTSERCLPTKEMYAPARDLQRRGLISHDGRGVRNLKLDGDNYYVSVADLSTEFRGLGWRILVLVPEEDVMKFVMDGIKWSVIVSVILVVVLLVAFSFLIQLLHRPLTDVVAKLQSAAYLDDTASSHDDSSSELSSSGNSAGLTDSPTSGAGSPEQRLKKKGSSSSPASAKANNNAFASARSISSLADVASIQLAYWSMADELRILKGYIPEHVREQLVARRMKNRERYGGLLGAAGMRHAFGGSSSSSSPSGSGGTLSPHSNNDDLLSTDNLHYSNLLLAGGGALAPPRLNGDDLLDAGISPPTSEDERASADETAAAVAPLQHDVEHIGGGAPMENPMVAPVAPHAGAGGGAAAGNNNNINANMDDDTEMGIVNPNHAAAGASNAIPPPPPLDASNAAAAPVPTGDDTNTMMPTIRQQHPNSIFGENSDSDANAKRKEKEERERREKEHAAKMAANAAAAAAEAAGPSPVFVTDEDPKPAVMAVVDAPAPAVAFATITTAAANEADDGDTTVVAVPVDEANADDVKQKSVLPFTLKTNAKSVAARPAVAPTPLTAAAGAAAATTLLSTGENSLEERLVSVVVVNLIGFHAYASATTSARIASEHEVLVNYIHDVAKRCGGVLDNFNGDRFWVSFNAAVDCADGPIAAALFACEVISVINGEAIKYHKLNQADMRRTGGGTLPPLARKPPRFSAALRGATVGIATGKAHVGPLGSSKIRRHTIISGVVSEAAALERLAGRYPDCGVVIADDMIAAIEGYCQYLVLDAILLPGSSGQRRRIASLKGPMMAKGCAYTPARLRHAKAFVNPLPTTNPYAEANNCFTAFLEGRIGDVKLLIAKLSIDILTSNQKRAENQLREAQEIAANGGQPLSARKQRKKMKEREKIRLANGGVDPALEGVLSETECTNIVFVSQLLATIADSVDGQQYRSPLGMLFEPR